MNEGTSENGVPFSPERDDFSNRHPAPVSDAKEKARIAAGSDR
jgi:hypothetical protein